MHILVLNGSPKANYSITLQTILYLEKKFKQHTFEVVHVSRLVGTLEKDFTKILSMMDKADLLLFSYPVYTFIAPSQLHHFISLLKKQNIDLSEKFATQITTSKHFYDVTAHRYIQDNCQDLHMKYIKGLSCDMDDLLSEKGRNEAEAFMKYVEYSVSNNIYERFESEVVHQPLKMATKTDPKEKKKGDVVIVTDVEENDESLQAMIDRFRTALSIESRVVNLREIRIDGGCLGCFNCAVDGKCIYKDRFDDYLRENIQKAQAVVYAFSIKDHSMGYLFKRYDDRNFCNGHRTVTMGMPFGYLINGYYKDEFNLQMIVEARCEVGGNFLAGVATSEMNPDLEIDKLAQKLAYAIDHHYVQPANFYGVGGMKIFRDLIYLMQGMMKADHKFYKVHHQYDFPQKKKGTLIMMYLVGFLLSNPKLKAKMGNKMNEGMLAPHKKILDSIKD